MCAVISRIGRTAGVAAVVVGLFGLSACTTTSEAANVGTRAAGGDGSIDGGPPPTIGIGSDIFSEVTTAIDRADIETVVMIGDSITVASETVIADQFTQLGFDDVRIVAQSGKRMDESFSDNTAGSTIAGVVREELDSEPSEQLWIVALGTNDVSQYDEQGIAGAIDAILDEVPADAPLVWVDTYVGYRPEETQLVNDAIDEAIAERGNATVAPWWLYAPATGVLTEDEVHPTDEGTGTFASVVTSTAMDFLRS
jgi:hypothetical protein